MAENKSAEKKNNEVIKSPEQLDDYLRVTSPGIWAVFVVVFLVLVALFVWASIGKLETLANAKAVVSGGNAEIILMNSEAGTISNGMPVRINGEEFTITRVEEDEYGRTIAYAPVSSLDGTYDATVVIESVTPISFLLKNK
ncbi:MAG: hypothetical protein J6Z43_07115 [Clostridiales bacterium]|nr:hypothetical protein [Clostridiales bacterium]